MTNFTIVPTVTILDLSVYGYLNELKLNNVNLLVNPDPKDIRTKIYAKCIEKGYNLLIHDNNEVRLVTHINPKYGIGVSINWRNEELRFRQFEYNGAYLLFTSNKSSFTHMSATRYHLFEHILTHPEQFKDQPRNEELEKIF